MMIKNVVAIYPGRFQPFGIHHFKTFKWVQKTFGSKNSYIGTSSKVGPKSPFNFKEKSLIIRKYKIPSSKIVQVKNPYVAQEITSKYEVVKQERADLASKIESGYKVQIRELKEKLEAVNGNNNTSKEESS